MAKSCYVLELSVVPGEARRGELFVATDLRAIVQRLAQEFAHPDARVRGEAAFLSVWYGETIVLWIVREGVLVGGLDLRPFLAIRVGDTPPIRLDDEANLEALRERVPDPVEVLQSKQPLAFELDVQGLAQEVPPLEGAPLLPGEETPLQRNENPLRQMGSYLALVDALSLGAHDLEQGEEEPEPEPEPAPEPPPPPAPAPPPPPPVSGSAISAVEHEGRLVARIPRERFTARVADQLKSRRREALQPGDAFTPKQRERLEREGCGFVAPLEFLSEVELSGRPLDRKGFDAAAQTLAPGLRGLEAQLPRFGPVLVLDWNGKRFVTSEKAMDPAVLEGLH